MPEPAMDNCPSSDGPPPLKYRCLDCATEFELPSPKGPAEESDYACPHCQSRHIKRPDVVKTEFCVPGG